ncbi:hypothetical protein [Flavivirga eckloniae]|uniref:DUF4407 domain-containing protein n=1 Tax=Flavivirga eckloniae TaxID=1803846 RepID=A0A2K9PSC1_9FLAO|nr:hypothetical protein [Flavivirga eckloniae]AUP79964.1 hypothetical protein C1H87_15140 [Flavivirga eckloniae]
MTDKTVGKVIPDEFYKASNFFTLSGAAGAVWLFCLVLANLDPDAKLFTPAYYRLIALGLSETIAIVMLMRVRRKKKFELWLFAFFNGLLIFINASGLNAISSKLSFENTSSIQSKIITNNTPQKASFVSNFFKREISWWIEDTYYSDKRQVLEKNEFLNKKNKQFSENINLLKIKYDSIHKVNDSLRKIISVKEKPVKEIIKLKTNDCKPEIDKLNDKIIKLRNLNNSITKGLTGKINKLENELNKYKKLEKSKMIKVGETPYSTLIVEIDRLRKKLIECESKYDQN